MDQKFRLRDTAEKPDWPLPYHGHLPLHTVTGTLLSFSPSSSLLVLKSELKNQKEKSVCFQNEINVAVSMLPTAGH